MLKIGYINMCAILCMNLSLSVNKWGGKLLYKFII